MQKYLDSVILRFVCQDYNRQRMLGLQYEDGKVIATEGHTLIMAPEKYIKEVPEFNPDWVAYKSIIPEYSKEPVFSINAKELYQFIEKIPKSPVFQICSECEGEGTVECHCCGHSGKCDDCYGKGITDKISHHEVDPKEHVLQMGTNIFNPNLFDKIIKVAQELGEDVIYCHHDVYYKSAVYLIADVIILHMPMYHSDEYTPKLHEFKVLTPTP